ncbi:hypothetical protein ACIHEI_37430 [Kitasatospora sp. NPDC051984]|uniref:hypothetical protein n=1 Tax=Kitasatospora sp. NPDC051984 TaxID=3364059 RepID=UPI0037C6744B
MEFNTARPLTDAQAAAEAARLIAEAYRQEAGQPAAVTSYRDLAPLPPVGPTPPATLPDSRTVPAWAIGTAVASVGVGLGVTGIGAGAWLVMDGMASVTLAGICAVLSPFVGLALVVLTAGTAYAKAAKSRVGTGPTTHVYKGTVNKTTEIAAPVTVRGMFARTKTEITG